ncbi:MAG: hypothetical protein IJY01_03760 [Clostridia bacterium]|nr:hypothetical protein [Clostridia bacterium]
MARKRKYSLSDRINYHGSRLNSKNKNQRAFSQGYIASANNDYFNPSHLKTGDEIKAYEKGFEKGHKALCKSHNIKF